MRYQLCISTEADAELEALWTEDPDAAALIEAIFDELEPDQELLDAMLQHGYVHQDNPQFDIKRWQELWRRGINLWRLKPHDENGHPIRYRVMYAYVPQKRRLVVLGILPRDAETYDPGSERGKRLLAQYGEL